MFILSTATAAPLIAYASRMAKGYWALPLRRVAALYAVPSLLSFVLLIPIMASLPPLDGRSTLWFEFRAGAPFLTDALALAILLLTGMALLWFSAVPDLAGPPSRVRAMGRWQRLLFLNWSGTARQWKVLRAANLALGAFYLMGYAFVHMLLTTDLGQSLLPGWRSGIFPVYSAVTRHPGRHRHHAAHGGADAPIFAPKPDALSAMSKRRRLARCWWPPR